MKWRKAGGEKGTLGLLIKKEKRTRKNLLSFLITFAARVTLIIDRGEKVCGVGDDGKLMSERGKIIKKCLL